jgi:hypothetical protein
MQVDCFDDDGPFQEMPWRYSLLGTLFSNLLQQQSSKSKLAGGLM